ncbi:peptidoglycan editing factor PgeF [Legionella sp. W05-934-2]|jgi:YfiH family protein|uniref:peptidoglycan editing factor PgeF n=1 Tax=Legionella sp. W05-934-2 TaxID=1198649 RepID=UPI0034630ACB
MIITPNWQAPKHVNAFASTRMSGASHYPYQYGNLGLRTGDTMQHVLQNRQLLMHEQSMPTSPVWLHQTHSTHVVDATHNQDNQADASITRQPNQILAILTADCLPIILTNKTGTEIAAIHAGWRGLCDGIIENTLKKMHSNANDCIAWVGPAICGHCFEVGDEVCDQFKLNYPFSPRYFFKQQKWHIHLDELAAHILRLNGVMSIQKSKLCTFEQKNLFYSYRRDGQTGRIGTFIWFDKPIG